MDRHEKKARKYEARAKQIEKIPSEAKTKRDKNFRPSHLQGINPRSRTYVRNNTVGERVLIPAGASTVGNLVAGPGGAVAASTILRSKNLSQDRTRSYSKKTGSPATVYIGDGVIGGYKHTDPKKLRAKAKEQRDKIKKGIGMESYMESVSAFGVEHEPVSKMGAKFNSGLIRYLNKSPHYRLRAGETTTSPDGLQATTRFSVEGKTNKGRRKLRRFDGDTTGTVMSPVAGDNKVGQRGLMSVAVPKGASKKAKRKLGFGSYRSEDPGIGAFPVTRKKKRYKFGP